MTTILKTVLVTILCLVIADILGVIVCTFFDVAPIRGSDGALLPYAIWFVLGVFCGLFAFSWSAGWAVKTEPSEANAKALPPAAANLVFLTGAAVLAGLAAFFHWLYWSRGVNGEYYVPDSMPHTIVFFIAVLGGMWLSRMVNSADPKAPSAG